MPFRPALRKLLPGGGGFVGSDVAPSIDPGGLGCAQRTAAIAACPPDVQPVSDYIGARLEQDCFFGPRVRGGEGAL